MSRDPYLALLRAIPADWTVRISFDIDIHSCRLFPDRHAYTHCVFDVKDGFGELVTTMVRPVIHPHLSVPTTPDLLLVAAELLTKHIAEQGVQEALPLYEPERSVQAERQAIVEEHATAIVARWKAKAESAPPTGEHPSSSIGTR